MARAKQHEYVEVVRQWALKFWEPSAPEYKFHPHRRWAFDLAWPLRMVAFELEGGTWIGGRHTSGAGYQSDVEKYSVAAALGWAVIRATPAQVKGGEALDWIEWSMRNRYPWNDGKANLCHRILVGPENKSDSPRQLPGSLTPKQRKRRGQ